MQVSFCSKYKFISPDKFFELTTLDKDAIEVSGLGYGAQSFKRSMAGDKIYTTYIGSCTAYGLGIEKNADYAALGHYNKDATAINDLVPNLKENMKKGFIIGGKSTCMKDFFEETFAKYKENGVTSTIFWGQNRGGTSVCYDPKEDTVYVSTPTWGEYVDSEESLKSAFDIINIADGDDVYIGDRKVNPLDIMA